MITVQLQVADHWTKEPVADATVTAILKVTPRWQKYEASNRPSAYAEASTELGGIEIFEGRVTNLRSGKYDASFEINPQLFEGVVPELDGPVYDASTAAGKIGHGPVDRLDPQLTSAEVTVAVAGESRTFTFVKNLLLYGPDYSWSEAVAIDFVSRGNDLIVAAVGDSIMWGEGLSDADKYVNQAKGGIGQLLGRRPVLAYFSARCGAVIDRAALQRDEFIDTYPHLFSSDADRDAFRRGNEAVAARLHGEIPCSFPTVMHQLSEINSDLGQNLDVLFINGGANDLDFAMLLASVDDDKFWMFYDPFYYEVFGRRLRELLHEARRRCPKATIILTGYYSAFSMKSSKDSIVEFIKHRAGVTAPESGLNFILNPVSFDTIGADFDEVATKLISRSLYGSSRAVYWMCKTIEDIRDRNLIFVVPGFREDNALFASAGFIHQRYEFKKLEDRQRHVRRSECRRETHFDDIWRMRMSVGALFKNQQFIVGNPTNPSRADCERLRERLDGPASLLNTLDELIDDFRYPSALDPSGEYRKRWSLLLGALDKELSRIDHCLIASFIHPNEAGAAQYARAVVERYKRHRSMGVRAHVQKLSGAAAGSAKISVRNALRRYGLNPASGLRPCMRHVFVDSLAVLIKTGSGDLPNGRLFLRLGEGREWLLNLGYGNLNAHAETNMGTAIYQGDFFTLGTFEGIHLGEVAELTLYHRWRFGSWTPEYVTLFINGSEVFSVDIGRPLEAGESVTLPYPAPLPPRRGNAPVVPQG